MISRWIELTRRGLPLGALGLALTLFPTGLSAQQLKPEKPSIKVDLPVNAISFMPIYIVRKETGKEEGLTVELVVFRGDAGVTQALAARSIDVALASLNA